jgi:hypothetical protein
MGNHTKIGAQKGVGRTAGTGHEKKMSTIHYSDTSQECLTMMSQRGWTNVLTVNCALEHFYRFEQKKQDELLAAHRAKYGNDYFRTNNPQNKTGV